MKTDCIQRSWRATGRIRSVRWLLPAALVFAVASAKATEPAPPRIAGLWRFVPEESEDARVKMQAARPEGSRPPGERPGGAGGGFPGGGPGGGGPGGGGRGGGRPTGPREHEGARLEVRPGDLMREFMDAAPRITIDQSDAEITIQNVEANTLILHPDGKPFKRAGGAIETRTAWKGNDLVSESKTGDAKLTTTYSLFAPGRLRIRSRLQSSNRPEVTVIRVYATDEQPPSDQ